MADPEKLSVTTLKRGSAIELIDEELARVLENIVDPNTDAEAVREVTLVLRFKPDEDRERVSLQIKVKSKMAPPTAASASIWVLHTKLGIVGVEDNPYQRALFEEPSTEADPPGETGEVASFTRKENKR